MGAHGWFGVLALLLCGGGGLPEFAQPRGSVGIAFDAGDAIPYRSLTRDDFRGSEPPPHLAPHRERIGAATCAWIVTTPETAVAIAPLPDRGAPEYQAVPVALGFQAFMDRSCSWWNDEQGDLAADYVLEHEQIHFALFELAARRLNARAREISESVTAVGATPEEAADVAEQRLRAVLERVLGEALERNREFDEETSFGHSEQRQRVWKQQVEHELG